MHLVELTERSSSITIVQQLQENGIPYINSLGTDSVSDGMGMAFQADGQLGKVSVSPTTAVSLSTMHEDICHAAEDKRVAIIVVPFHK